MYDLDSMILILKLDLYMIKMYHLAKIEVSMSIGSKVIAQTGKQTDRHADTTKTSLLPHKREVKPCRKKILKSSNYSKSEQDFIQTKAQNEISWFFFHIFSHRLVWIKILPRGLPFPVSSRSFRKFIGDFMTDFIMNFIKKLAVNFITDFVRKCTVDFVNHWFHYISLQSAGFLICNKMAYHQV